MAKFLLEYNNITSVFNGTECGHGGTMVNNKYVSHFIKYSVRPSKTNLLNVSSLIKCVDENGLVTWHFYTRGTSRIPRGLKVFCKKIA